MAKDDEYFVAIRVATLRGDLKIPFDVYVRIAGKHILYCRRGDSFEGSRLERLRTKKLKKMYIQKKDDAPYRQYLEESIDSAYDSKSPKPLAVRAEVIQGFQQATAEDYMEDPLDQFSYGHMRSSTQRFTDFLIQDTTAAAQILQIKNTDQSASHHGVNVATLSVALAIETRVGEGSPLHLMALGALIHDIEHFFSPLDLTKPLASMSKDEMAMYKRHPLKGGHRLQTATFVDTLVMNIILQHEETMDATGFPKRLAADEMDPLVILVATCNAYDRLVSFTQMAPKDALKNLLIDKMGQYPLPHLQSLQKLLKQYALI